MGKVIINTECIENEYKILKQLSAECTKKIITSGGNKGKTNEALKSVDKSLSACYKSLAQYIDSVAKYVNDVKKEFIEIDKEGVLAFKNVEK